MIFYHSEKRKREIVDQWELLYDKWIVSVYKREERDYKLNEWENEKDERVFKW